MIPRPVGIAIWVVIGVALLILIIVGTRRISRRGTDVVPALPPVPEALGDVESVRGIYVCTTLAGDWLARVGAHGLGQRAGAVARVAQAGLLIERDGAADLFIPVQAIESVGLISGMAGKFVGRDWIVAVTWTVPTDAGTTRLDTGFMPDQHADAPALRDAIQALADTVGPATDPKEDR